MKHKTKLTGIVIRPNDPGYQEAHMNWNPFTNAFPSVFVFARQNEDVANAVKWARENNVPIRMRSGRHALAKDFSQTDCGLVIDTGLMTHVMLDTSQGIATVEAGMRVGPLVRMLAQKGFLAPFGDSSTVGIGGISMSAIALLLKNHGYNVTGSDRSESDMVKTLRSKGITVSIGHKKENIHENSIIVYTYAVKEDNEEYIKSKELGLPMYSRAEFLGLVMKNYKYSVGVSGTHGKTTTTSMASHVLLRGDTDPTLFVGGNLDAINGNLKIGESEYFLTEACEYKESFLNFFPYIGIILNVDEDHLDYYKDLYDIENAFVEYAEKLPVDGFLIVNKLYSNLFDDFQLPHSFRDLGL